MPRSLLSFRDAVGAGPGPPRVLAGGSRGRARAVPLSGPERPLCLGRRRAGRPRWRPTSPSRSSSTSAACSWCTGAAATSGRRRSASSSCTAASSSPRCRCGVRRGCAGPRVPRGLRACRPTVSNGRCSPPSRLCFPPSSTSRPSLCTRDSSWWGKWARHAQTRQRCVGRACSPGACAGGCLRASHTLSLRTNRPV